MLVKVSNTEDKRLKRERGHIKHNSEESFEDDCLTELQRVHQGITQRVLFDSEECEKIEAKINKVVSQAERGYYREKTVDKAPLRIKYFFGEGYISIKYSTTWIS